MRPSRRQLLLRAAAALAFAPAPPAAAGPVHAERTAEVPIDGGALHAVRVGPPDCRRGMVALHGGPGVSHEALRALDALAGEDRCVVYFDQRGGGGSTGPAGPWTAADLAADVDAVRAWWGFRQVDVVGHSWGAYLAALYAAEHPRRVASLVYSSPAPLTPAGWTAFERAMHARIAALRATGRIPDHLPAVRGDDCTPATAPLEPAYLFDPDRPVVEAPTSCSASAFSRSWSALPRASLRHIAERVRHRATLIQGEGEATGAAIRDEWTRYHAGRLDVQVVPQCGHVLHTECPERWVRAIREALR